uniref:Uncharacterized protein n=1 Tax=Oryza sativa subsp. japonica TaxID=39947 RepID=Q5Z703_ORYSJ|nr:hypothetical protein [Oryza sativa Japonica Group]
MTSDCDKTLCITPLSQTNHTAGFAPTLKIGVGSPLLCCGESESQSTLKTWADPTPSRLPSPRKVGKGSAILQVQKLPFLAWGKHAEGGAGVTCGSHTWVTQGGAGARWSGSTCALFTGAPCGTHVAATANKQAEEKEEGGGGLSLCPLNGEKATGRRPTARNSSSGLLRKEAGQCSCGG